MYGVAGERRLTEFELPWLPGYEGSAPVRVGNAASEQLQIDVYGEVMDALYQARAHGLRERAAAWALQKVLLDVPRGRRGLEPDQGIWEIRGEPRHFVHSKVMAWVAFDRAVRTVEEQGLDGPIDEWRSVRDAIHAQVCERGYDDERGIVRAVLRVEGARREPAACCRSSAFCPRRTRGFAARSRRSSTSSSKTASSCATARSRGVDGLPPGEGVFLPCSFWLVDCYELIGRHDDARALFERLVGLANDVGLLSEEYDPAAKRLLGNFPQAFTHLALVNSAFNVLPHLPSPMHRRHAEHS